MSRIDYTTTSDRCTIKSENVMINSKSWNFEFIIDSVQEKCTLSFIFINAGDIESTEFIPSSLSGYIIVSSKGCQNKLYPLLSFNRYISYIWKVKGNYKILTFFIDRHKQNVSNMFFSFTLFAIQRKKYLGSDCQTIPYTIQSGDTCYAIAQRLGLPNYECLIKLNPNLNCMNLRIGQIINVPNGTQYAYSCCITCEPLQIPNPLTPPTAAYPIIGFWYLTANQNCVQNSQVVPPTPQQSTLASYFEYYLGDFKSIDFNAIPFPCFSNANLGGFQLTYNNYYYRCYTLGNSAVDWNSQAVYITSDFVAQMIKAGYNSVILDIESVISPANFNSIVTTFTDNGINNIMLYSTQYNNYFTPPLTQYQFSKILYGMPSIYGKCDTATLCDNLRTWTDLFGFPINRLVMAVVKDTWSSISEYSYILPNGDTTTVGKVVAGYIEWNYDLYNPTCQNYIVCNTADKCSSQIIPK